MTFFERAKALVAKMTVEEKILQMQHSAPAIERLGVPAYNWWNECLHGVARQGTATVFPQAIGMAASFNTDLMEEVATAISDEARAKYNKFKTFGDTQIYEGLTYWSPNINIFRDPRWGRGHETYGEDPYLTGRMGMAFVRGLQGNGKYRKVDATIKHFAVHSGPEGLRHEFNAEVSKKDLYETYLWAFRYVIEHASPSAVMGAYNRVNGSPCCASEQLLVDILRGEFGFDGYVVSDVGAIHDINRGHKVTGDTAESAALAVNKGCQLLDDDKPAEWLKEAFDRNLVSEETITRAVEKLFETRFRLGMFDTDCEYDKIPFEIVDCAKHRALNRKMAQESAVLLKNDGILPLKRDLTLAVIGPNADDKSVLLSNYNGVPSHYSTILSGIQKATTGRVLYSCGAHAFSMNVNCPENEIREAMIVAREADAVILCVGLTPSMEGEEGDATSGASCMRGDKTTLALPIYQQKLVEAVCSVGKPVIYVNVSGSCLDLSFAKEHANAVFQYFYPGAEGGDAFADILFGDVSPSGRLPVSFYRSVDDLPAFEDYRMENRTYKFFGGEFVYEFGEGLTYSDVKEEWKNENTVVLSNKGSFDTAYSVLKFEHIPYKNLCGFKKVMLKAGETVTVTFDAEGK